MTNAEAVAAAIQFTGYSPASLDKALLDAGINGTADYVTGTKAQINLVAVEVLQGMLGVSQVQEGGYSISYSASGLQARINYLLGDSVVSTEPKVRAVHLW